MAKKYRYITIGLIIILLPVLIWISYHIYMTFFAPPTLSYIPKGKLIEQIKSPNQDYTLKAYVSSGGATTDYAIRGELIFNKKDIKPKNIYWNYHEEKANIKWIKNNTVIINGHKLIVPNQTYDFRNE
ncbi:DUF5412 family protein [Gottfriedia sp. S16(2024)]|uniref:DUF5412 family protein n=1 Tax=Gottfriedia sp. S16(2024) TaxID=3162883 RepID=UPI003D1F2861